MSNAVTTPIHATSNPLRVKRTLEIQTPKSSMNTGHEKTEPAPTAIEMKDLSSWYGNFQALNRISLNVRKNKVTAFIGPSGCGKST